MSTIAPAKTAFPRQEHVYLPGISYATYDALVTEVGERRNLRFTYHHGEMEIMTLSQEHGRIKKLIGRMVEALTEVLGIPVSSVGSTTFKDELRDCGLEPDECYYIQHESHVRGRKVKLGEDPPPDLVIEVDITTRVVKRLPIYATLGFPEIWQYVGGGIAIHLLQPNGQYAISKQSLALPTAPLNRLVEHLNRCDETDETTWIRAFRKWVRGGVR